MKRIPFAVRIACACLAILAASAPLLAQAPPARPATAAPGVITGSVRADAGGEPLSGAAVSVRSARDSALVTGVVTTAHGGFRVEGLPFGDYLVRVSFLGYKPVDVEAKLSAQAPLAALGELRLVVDAVALGEVKVEAERAAVSVQIDRTVYTTQNMPGASGGTATDILRNVPELEVDIDGNVKMQGSQSVAIHINGRPSPIKGEGLKNFLQTLPADRIDRVEVVPNPSAKYDPEGMAGIVNIVMKENMDLGLSGSASLGLDSRGRANTYGSLAYQRGRVTVFGSGSFNLNSNTNTTFDLRRNLLADPVTYFEMRNTSESEGRFGFGDASVEVKLGKLETAYASIRGHGGGNDSDVLAHYAVLDAERAPTSRYDQFSLNEWSNHNVDMSIGVRRVVKPQQHEATLELRRNSNGFGHDSDFDRVFLTPEGDPGERQTEVGANDSETDAGETVLQADYTRPVGAHGRLETGYKGALRATDYDQLYRTHLGSRDAHPIGSQASAFEYEERYHQAYLMLGRQFGGFGVQAGARGELARTEFVASAGDTFDREYESLFPSANLSYTFAPGKQARLSYSKRVERPNPNMLNPSQPATDSLNRYSGNPGLRPKYTHSFSLDLSRSTSFGMLRLAPYFRRTTDNWEYFKIVDENGVATLTWQNTAEVDAYGTNATVSVRLADRGNGFLSLNAYRLERDASNISAAYSGDGFRWELSGNGMVKVREGLDVQGFVRYSAPQELPQGRIGGHVFSNLGLRQRLLGNKAWVNLSVTDPFDAYRFRFETRDATHEQVSRNRVSIRAVRVGFTYSFGRPPQSARRRQDEPQQQEPQVQIH